MGWLYAVEQIIIVKVSVDRKGGWKVVAPGSTPGGSSPDQKWSCPLQAASAAYAFQKYIDSMLAELT